jgi:predicted nucleotidyltransferase
MNRDQAIAVLRQNRAALQARGVRHAALFGSAARGEAGPRSDLDVLIELEPDIEIDAFAYAGLKRFIADLFKGPVDVVNRAGLKAHLKRPVADDAIYAF